MGQNRRRTGGRRNAGDNIKYIRLAAIPILVVIVLVIIIAVMDRRQGAETADATVNVASGSDASMNPDAQAPEDGSVEPDNSQYTTDYSQYELKKDEVPQVNQLMSEYFQAKVEQDPEKLYKLFGRTDETGVEERREELKNEAVYTEDYQNLVCYTKPGLTADSYVAYVTYEVKFRRVDTLAPGLMWCYVVKGDDGNYIIRENVVGDEADYVAKQNQSEDVRLLSNQVNERLRQAIESDTLLAGIYKDLRNGAIVDSSEEGGEDSTVFLDGEGGASAGDATPSDAAPASSAAASDSSAAPAAAGDGSGAAPAADASAPAAGADGGTAAPAAGTQGGTGDKAGDSKVVLE